MSASATADVTRRGHVTSCVFFAKRNVTIVNVAIAEDQSLTIEVPGERSLADYSQHRIDIYVTMTWEPDLDRFNRLVICDLPKALEFARARLAK